MKRFIIAAVMLVFFLVGAGFGAGRYNNKKYGFSIAAPAKWTRIPQKPQEKWIVARFKCNREYSCEDGYSTHCPVMKVILFPRKAEEEDDDKPKIEDGSVTITFKNPYKNYKDYLKQNFRGGGYFISSEVQGKQYGTPVTRLVVTVEKLAQYGKQRIITWVFHGEVGDFAVQTDIIELRYDKVAPMIMRALQTFRMIDCDPKAKEDDDFSKRKLKIGKKQTPAERKKERIAFTDRLFSKAVKDLPPGWGQLRTKYFQVIYHSSKNKAMRYSNQAEVFRSWLNKRFDRIGKEYVAPCLLRVCKNWDEEKVYRNESSDFSAFEDREITTNVAGEDKRYEFEYINTKILHKFFNDKNQRLWWGLPHWLEKGLDQYLGTAVAKGRRLVFKPDSWEKENIRDGRRNGQLIHLKELMLRTSKDAYDPNNYEAGQVFRAQCGSFVRYLFGPGNRGSTKDLIFRYLEELMVILKEKDKAEEEERERRRKEREEEDEEPMTEEEEEEAFKKKKSKDSTEAYFREKSAILEQVMARTFKGWSESHWDSLDGAWRKWSK